MSYSDPLFDGLPSIHRRHATREVWKLDEYPKETHLHTSVSQSHHQRNIFELQDQLKSQREELRRKEELIRELSSLDVRGSGTRFNCPAASTAVDHTHSAVLMTTRSEVAALQVKCDNLAAKLRDKQIELETSNDKVATLRREVDRLKEENMRQLSLNADLSRQLDCLDANKGSWESMKNQSTHVVMSLQEQYRVAQDKIIELEARIRSNFAERERAVVDKSGIEKKHNDFVNSIIYRLGTGSADYIDGIVDKVGELVQENITMKSKIATNNELVAANESEMRANRETIQRLLAEIAREQKNTLLHRKTEIDASSETNTLRAEKADLEKQVELLDSRIESNRKVIEVMKAELSEKEALVSKLDCEKRESLFAAENSQKQLVHFIESLASLLSSAYAHVTPTEEAVKEKIKVLVKEVKEQSTSVAALEDRMRSVTKQFESQFENQRSIDIKARRHETEFFDMKERIRILESELAAGDVIRDGLRADKEKFYRYMQKLAALLKMDHIGVDIGFDMLGEGLLARAEQVCKMEMNTIHDKTSTIYSMQRKVKSLKEQMESKDLHIDLLRKKIASLEERVAGRTDLERDRDHETLRVRSLQKHLEKSQVMLEDARAEIVNLKSQLLQCSGLKITAIEQDKELESLERTLEKLERVRQKQAKKIACLKNEVVVREKDGGDRRVLTEGTLQSLTSELRTTKSHLDECRRKERQLLEFRAVVARMLGLDLDSLSIPDYEIINRLERLIQAHQSNVYTAFSMDRSLKDMEGTFQEGYVDANQLVSKRVVRRRSRSPGYSNCTVCRLTRCGCTRNSAQHRARSVSPKRDPRKY